MSAVQTLRESYPMRVLARRKAAALDAARLHEHEAVRDVVARLIAAMEAMAVEKSASFLFSSLREGQGTSTMAAAVARGLAETGRRTLLGVVGRPPVEGTLDAVALKDVVDGRAARFGQPPLLTVEVPPRLTDVPESARDPRAWVDGLDAAILDAPSLTDGLTRYWIPRVHGVVLVLDGEKIAVHAAVQARADVERLGGRLVGVILNRYRSRIPRWLAPYFG